MLTNDIEPTWLELMKTAETIHVDDPTILETWRKVLSLPTNAPEVPPQPLHEIFPEN
jgi:hypothetical protein